MSIVIPIDYVLDGTQSGHRMMRCAHTKKVNGVVVQCIKRYRVSTVPIIHEHVFPIVIPRPVTDIATAKTNIEIAVAIMIAACNMSVNSVANDSIRELVFTCIHIGSMFSTVKAQDLTPEFTRAKTTNFIRSQGDLIQKECLLPFTKTFSTLMLDASTLVHKRILAIMLSANDNSTKPSLYDSVYSPKLRVVDFAEILIPMMEEMVRSGVKLGAIVGDNCPTQVLALAHWSPSKVYGDHPCLELRALRFFTCAVHTTALMLSDSIDECIEIQRLVSTLTQLVTAVNSSYASDVIGHCPQPGETRWLSRIEGIDWLLLHEDSLKRFPFRDDIDLEPPIRRMLAEAFVFSHFEELRVLAILIFPFYAMTLALESDNATQSLVIPFTEQLKDFFLRIADDLVFAQYPGLIDKIITCIDERFKLTYDSPLLCATCLLSIEGRAWFLTQIYEGPDKDQYDRWRSFCPPEINFKYSSSDRHIFPEERDEIHSTISVDEQPLQSIIAQSEDEQENDDDAVPPAPPVPPGRMESMYDDALSAICGAADDLCIPTDDFPSLFASYCFGTEIDDHLWNHRKSNATTIWKTLSLKDGMKTFVRVCIRLIGVSASECPVEREFSLDKLILTRLRNRMSTPILKARSRIQSKYSNK